MTQNQKEKQHQGLSNNEVLELRKKFGFNIIPVKDDFFWLKILFAQFKSPLIYILLFVALISGIFGEFIDVILILAVAVLNVLMGFYQEYNAQKTLKALRSFLKSTAWVIRGGVRLKIDKKELVPGDIVYLGSGDKVPADGVILESANLLINEAILTGESEAVSKDTSKKKSNVFMGSAVSAGLGLMRVEKIGLETEIGKISHTLSEIPDEKTPFQKKLEVLSRNLALIILGVCFLIFLAGLIFSDGSIWQIFQIAIILSVAAIPEGLPIALTVVMALGMRRILKKQGLVKKMVSLETLGSVSVILTDKTGTLTEGMMRVIETSFTNKDKALLALSLVNNQRDSLEIAIWRYLEKELNKKPEEVAEQFTKVFHEPFSSEKKYALTINQKDNDFLACLLGAPEVVLGFCNLKIDEKKKFLSQIDYFAEKGFRMVSVAEKLGNEVKALEKKKEFSFLGFVAIEDPLRTTAKEAVEKAKSAGIEVKMVTGDYRKTAESIARELNLKTGRNNIMEGEGLEKLSVEELQTKIDDVSVFCRVSPHQKLKIVQALKAKNEHVAMVGDGINDALALKKADIGIVVGEATDVARETSDLILLDGSFKTITDSIEEGRLAFSNIKKVVAYVLSNSFVEIVLIFGALIFKLPSPLLVAQILWLHLICDGPPDITLSFEKKDEGLMLKKPKDISREQILAGPAKAIIASISLVVGGIALAMFWYLFSQTGDLSLARTLAFLSIGAVDLLYVFSFKDLEKPLFKIGSLFSNKWLLMSSLYGFGLLLIGTYVPFFNKILGTTPLPLHYWLIVLGVGAVSIILVEAIKTIARRLHKA